jgi:hypothetical protein
MSWVRDMERRVLSEIGKLPADGSFEELPHDHHAFQAQDWRLRPVRAWRSRQFVVQLYNIPSEGVQRLSVQRTGANRYIREQNRNRRPISWEELMAVKAALGFDSWWAVELYPPVQHAINVADMRHLWLLPEAPQFGWRRSLAATAKEESHGQAT